MSASENLFQLNSRKLVSVEFNLIISTIISGVRRCGQAQDLPLQN